MLQISTEIVSGAGALPKDVDIDSVIMLDASDNIGTVTFEWEVISKPEDSTSLFTDPISSTTRFGPLNTTGVYLLRLTTNRNLPSQQTKTVVISVPVDVVTPPDPPTPNFRHSGKLVRNGSFELPGPFDGWAAYWTVTDTAGVLNERAGITRGRCIPTNFVPTNQYAFVLGDDIGGTVDSSVGEYFEVSQEIDFTNSKTLTITIQFRAP